MKMPQWSPVRAVARHVAEEYDWCPDRPHHTKSFLPWGTQVYCPSNLESQATIFTLPTCSVVSSFFKLASVKMKVHTLSQNLYVCRWPWKYKRPGISGWEKLKVKYKCNGKHVNENKPQVSTRAAFSRKLPVLQAGEWGPSKSLDPLMHFSSQYLLEKCMVSQVPLADYFIFLKEMHWCHFQLHFFPQQENLNLLPTHLKPEQRNANEGLNMYSDQNNSNQSTY